MLAAARAEMRPLGTAGPIVRAPKPDTIPESNRGALEAEGVCAMQELTTIQKVTKKIVLFMIASSYFPAAAGAAGK